VINDGRNAAVTGFAELLCFVFSTSLLEPTLRQDDLTRFQGGHFQLAIEQIFRSFPAFRTGYLQSRGIERTLLI